MGSRMDSAPAVEELAAGGPAVGGRSAGRMMRLPRKLGKRGGVADTELTGARSQLADELRLLREGHARPDAERRELLADLASRLDALLRHLRQRGAAETELTPLVQLASALRAPGSLDELWAQALRVLEKLTGKPDRRQSFWT
jgi:Ca-activated chloride channel family protein